MQLFLIQFELKNGKAFSVKDEILVPAKDAESAKQVLLDLTSRAPGLIVPRPKGPRMLIPLNGTKIQITGCAKAPSA